MIVAPDNQEPASPKLAAEGSAQENRSPDSETDLPPVYSQSDEQNAESSTSESRPSGPPNIKPSNFTRVLQPNHSIKGSWIIDGTLRIPTIFLPPLEADETEATRKNLSLISKNGSVDADIFVVPTQGTDQKRPGQRVTIHTLSYNGAVTTKVYDIASTDPQKRRLPLAISSISKNGRVYVHLPRSFHGLVTLELRNGNVRYSSDMQALLTPLSDVNGTHRSFVGHFDPSEFENEEEWVGDELTVEAYNGNVRVYFNDETIPPSTSFWAKLFGV